MSKKSKTIKEKVINGTRNIFEKEKDHHKPENLDKFYSDSFNIYEISVDENKTRSIEEYLDKIRPYLRDFIKDLRKI